MGKKRVLIVDDEEPIRLLVFSILDKDYIVIEASDGGEAISVAHRQKPDLILMDILMPRVDGYTACYRLKNDAVTKAIPVVMLTGVGFELNEKLSRQLGADGYITKPFSPQELRDMIDKFLKSPN